MDFRQALLAFLERNPLSELVQTDDSSFLIKRPWGDDSLLLEGKDEEATSLIESLVHLYLPPRFSAICHCDYQAVEFIWTYAPPDHRLVGRKFRFWFGDSAVDCEWREASERLLTLARHSRSGGPPTLTDYRNLFWLRQFQSPALPPGMAANVKDFKPLSFWLTNIPSFDDETLVRLAKHLNFFMRYYDRDSPVIIPSS